jgi:hypothetical protein
VRIDGLIHRFRERKEGETPPIFDFGPKTLDELFDRIREDIENVLKGEPPGWL